MPAGDRHGWKRPTLAACVVGAAVALPLVIFAGATAQASEGSLEQFRTCDDVVRVARDRMREATNTGGGRSFPWANGGVPAATSRLDMAESQLQAGAPKTLHTEATDQEYSGTNVQVAGIDEPDLVKTDGTRIVAIASRRVHTLVMRDGNPELVGSVALPDGLAPAEMLILGDRVLLISTGAVSPAAEPVPEPGRVDIYPAPAGTTLLEVDIADMAAPRVADRLDVDAAYVSARLTGETARVVLTSWPTVTPAASALGDDTGLAEPDIDDVIPGYALTDDSGATSEGRLVECANVSYPSDSTDVGMLSILTIDLAQGIRPVDSDAIMTSASTVMASPNRVYVALQGPAESGSGGMATTVHSFDSSEANHTDYVASGTVDGTLLNQFAMSEHDGYLRVATTTWSSSPVITTMDDGPVTSIAPAQTSQSGITVLRENGDSLRQVGQVTGLGKGERIYAVRFIGPTGYVVTFRETDPLYTVDLSDPRNPRTVGELKIPGYSAYLHPIDDTRLIGVGQAVDGAGGLQVSLFDVSQPETPRRTHVWTLPQSWANAEADHRAFLWWPSTSTLVLPMSGSAQIQGNDVRPASGALVLRVTDSGIEQLGMVIHPDVDQTPIVRSTVVGPTLMTLSDRGLGISDLTGAERGWINLGQ